MPVVFVVLVFVYPVGSMFRLSFTEIFGDATGVLGNYHWYLTNDVQLAILRRTFVVAAWVTSICLLVGFPYAYLMTRVGPRTRLLMLAAVLLPFWSNIVARTYAWVILLGDVGPVRSVLKTVGLGEVHLIGNMTGVTIGAAQVLLPFMILPLYATLNRIDLRLLDAAESLGAKPRRAFLGVYLPLALPGILAGSLIVFILTLGFYFTPAFLGSTRNSLVSQQIVTQVNQLLAFGRGGAMALVLLSVALVLLAVVSIATRRLTKALGSGTGGR
ncbi:ABC transporter permease [Nocardioides sp. QY071]|uniref:ABC transporter permease n=1 Tax=Nocardioides sp. QY071 TaxID=3044187 RepID=UPI00249A3C2D|nr:ABC transporter permease [Nocardioides sp. QY071]WGY02894.1 ABC transporter permease [Nocardioides sp. QY071]